MCDLKSKIINNQLFILFKEPARVLREALRSSLPLKDRLMIKLENDMRYGEVRFDHWLLHAKVNLIIIHSIEITKIYVHKDEFIHRL